MLKTLRRIIRRINQVCWTCPRCDLWQQTRRFGKHGRCCRCRSPRPWFESGYKGEPDPNCAQSRN